MPLYTQLGIGAQMVQLLCYNQIRRLNDWNQIPGQHLEEWEEEEECQLTPLDTWARQCIPMEMKPRPPSAFDDNEFVDGLAKVHKLRKLSAQLLASVEMDLLQRRNSTALLKAARRASEPENVKAESKKFFKEAIHAWSTRYGYFQVCKTL